MTYLLINLILAFVWTFLSGDPTLRSFFFGFILGFIALLPYRKMNTSDGYIYRAIYLVRFIMMFLYVLVRSTLEVLYEVATPTHNMRPGIVAIDIAGMSPLSVFILANSLTLTPGTMSLAISRREQKLFIHAMYASDPDGVRADIEFWLKQPLLLVMPAAPAPAPSIQAQEAL